MQDTCVYIVPIVVEQCGIEHCAAGASPPCIKTCASTHTPLRTTCMYCGRGQPPYRLTVQLYMHAPLRMPASSPACGHAVMHCVVTYVSHHAMHIGGSGSVQGSLQDCPATLLPGHTGCYAELSYHQPVANGLAHNVRLHASPRRSGGRLLVSFTSGGTRHAGAEPSAVPPAEVQQLRSHPPSCVPRMHTNMRRNRQFNTHERACTHSYARAHAHSHNASPCIMTTTQLPSLAPFSHCASIKAPAPPRLRSTRPLCGLVTPRSPTTTHAAKVRDDEQYRTVHVEQRPPRPCDTPPHPPRPPQPQGRSVWIEPRPALTQHFLPHKAIRPLSTS